MEEKAMSTVTVLMSKFDTLLHPKIIWEVLLFFFQTKDQIQIFSN